ncbi:hypothetical protein [Rhizobium sp. 007]|uniref:hypothetical protein n=1 Tax=Rhizobium sp. 007 TaxID=2785056 RepID=UPI0032B22B1A
MEELFSLIGYDELTQAEEQYLAKQITWPRGTERSSLVFVEGAHACATYGRVRLKGHEFREPALTPTRPITTAVSMRQSAGIPGTALARS